MGDQLAIWVVVWVFVVLAVCLFLAQDRRITSLERWRHRRSRDDRARTDTDEWWRTGGEFPGTFE